MLEKWREVLTEFSTEARKGSLVVSGDINKVRLALEIGAIVLLRELLEKIDQLPKEEKLFTLGTGSDCDIGLTDGDKTETSNTGAVYGKTGQSNVKPNPKDYYIDGKLDRKAYMAALHKKKGA